MRCASVLGAARVAATRASTRIVPPPAKPPRLYCAVPFERSALGVWKRLTRAERVEAAGHFWADPPNELRPVAEAVLVKALHVRPQSVRTLPEERKVQGLAMA